MGLGFTTPALIRSNNVGPVTLTRPALSRSAKDGTKVKAPGSTIRLNPVSIYHVAKADTDDRSNKTADRQYDRVAVLSVIALRHNDEFPFDGATWRVVHLDPYGVQASVYYAEAERLPA